LTKQKVIVDNLELESKQDKGQIKVLSTELKETQVRLASAEATPCIEINNLESPVMSFNTDTGKAAREMTISHSQNAD